MSVLPADFPRHKVLPDAGVCSDNPTDNPVVKDILELRARHERDAREAWQKAREGRFAEQIYDDLHVLDDAVALLADRSKAAATARKYKLHWVRFVKFAAEKVLDDGYGMRALPASPELVAFFLLSELTRGQSYSAVKQAGSAISDAHVTNFLPDPTQSLVCRAAVRLARQHDGKFQNVELNDKGSEQAVSKSNGNGSNKEASDGDEGT